MKKKILIFDIDNTITKTTGKDYKNARPKKKIVSLINSLKKNGHYIKIYTGRYMGRHNNNANLVKKKYYNSVEKQLRKWNLEYDELLLGKPSYDIFVDDKCINPKFNNLIHFLKKKKLI
jgi:capsule biosynthesis phosphatase